MSGRDLFDNYGKYIVVLTKLVAILPKAIVLWLLSKTRYKTGKTAMLCRYLAVSVLATHVGKNVAIFPGVYFENIENLYLGDNVSIHQMCYIDAEGGITIGDNVSIAHRSTILSSNHIYNDPNIPIKYQGMSVSETVIKDNVWVGCGCVILAGVEIGDGCVIGANSTVVNSIPNNSIAVGSPARVIKNRIELENS